MDHYKNREKQKKNKSFGAMLIQKMRGLTKVSYHGNFFKNFKYYPACMQSQATIVTASNGLLLHAYWVVVI